MNNSIIKKRLFYKLFSYLLIAVFLFYWSVVLLLAVPANFFNEKVGNNFPRFKATFTNSWQLFTPPYTYNERLYFITRDRVSHGRSDTIEVLEKISREKQHAVPFNQNETIIDHFVFNNMAGLLKTIWRYKKLPYENLPIINDSLYVDSAIAEVATSKNYMICLQSLKNYSKLILKENKIDTTGKEVKILITAKMIPPFKEIHNPLSITKEILLFQTPYQFIGQ